MAGSNNSDSNSKINRCISPQGCSLGTQIDPKNPPKDAVPFECTGLKCTETGWLHQECCGKLEDFLVGVLTKSSCITTGWGNRNFRVSMWGTYKKNTGPSYYLIRKFCKCPCGGYLKRDFQAGKENFQAEPKQNKKKKRLKQDSLPELVNNMAIGKVKLKGYNVNSTSERFKSDAGFTAATAKLIASKNNNPPHHFWEAVENETEKAEDTGPITKREDLVGAASKPTRKKAKSRSESSRSGSECGAVASAGGNAGAEERICDAKGFFREFRHILQQEGGTVPLMSKKVRELLDRVEYPLAEDIFGPTDSLAEWFMVTAPLDMRIKGDGVVEIYPALTPYCDGGLDQVGIKPLGGPSVAEKGEEEWTTVTKRSKEKPPPMDNFDRTIEYLLADRRILEDSMMEFQSASAMVHRLLFEIRKQFG